MVRVLLSCPPPPWSLMSQPPCFSRNRSIFVLGTGGTTRIRLRLAGVRANSARNILNWVKFHPGLEQGVQRRTSLALDDEALQREGLLDRAPARPNGAVAHERRKIRARRKPRLSEQATDALPLGPRDGVKVLWRLRELRGQLHVLPMHCPTARMVLENLQLHRLRRK